MTDSNFNAYCGYSVQLPELDEYLGAEIKTGIDTSKGSEADKILQQIEGDGRIEGDGGDSDSEEEPQDTHVRILLNVSLALAWGVVWHNNYYKLQCIEGNFGEH